MAKEEKIINIAQGFAGNKEFNMVAIIVKAGNILSIGINDMRKTHPSFWNGQYDRGVHAEYDALRQVKHQDIINARMYVMYFRKDGTLGNSKPCLRCQEMISKVSIKSVYYVKNGLWKKL